MFVMVAGAQAARAYLCALRLFLIPLAFILDANTYNSHLFMSKASNTDGAEEQYVRTNLNEQPATEQGALYLLLTYGSP